MKSIALTALYSVFLALFCRSAPASPVFADDANGALLGSLVVEAVLDASERAMQISNVTLHHEPPGKEKTWLLDHKMAFYHDFRMSNHVWTHEARPACATSKGYRGADIVLSYSACAYELTSLAAATKLLFRMAALHLGVEDEAFRRAIADKAFAVTRETAPSCAGLAGTYRGRAKSEGGETGLPETFHLTLACASGAGGASELSGGIRFGEEAALPLETPFDRTWYLPRSGKIVASTAKYGLVLQAAVDADRLSGDIFARGRGKIATFEAARVEGESRPTAVAGRFTGTLTNSTPESRFPPDVMLILVTSRHGGRVVLTGSLRFYEGGLASGRYQRKIFSRVEWHPLTRELAAWMPGDDGDTLALSARFDENDSVAGNLVSAASGELARLALRRAAPGAMALHRR